MDTPRYHAVAGALLLASALLLCMLSPLFSSGVGTQTQTGSCNSLRIRISSSWPSASSKFPPCVWARVGDDEHEPETTCPHPRPVLQLQHRAPIPEDTLECYPFSEATLQNAFVGGMGKEGPATHALATRCHHPARRQQRPPKAECTCAAAFDHGT